MSVKVKIVWTQNLQELLALGDKMGTVSTALSEEALSRSLKKSIYQETDETGANSLNMDDNLKCSICQVSLLLLATLNLKLIHWFVYYLSWNRTMHHNGFCERKKRLMLYICDAGRVCWWRWSRDYAMWTYVPCELCTSMAADEELVPHLQNLCRRREVVVVDNVTPNFSFVGWLQDDADTLLLHQTPIARLYIILLSLFFCT